MPVPRRAPSLLWCLGFDLALFAGTACALGAGARGTLVLIAQGVRQMAGIIAVILRNGALAGVWRRPAPFPSLVWAERHFFRCLRLSPLRLSAEERRELSRRLLLRHGEPPRRGPHDGRLRDQPREALCAGAILAGIDFGDRRSPVSPSTPLCACFTQTGVREL